MPTIEDLRRKRNAALSHMRSATELAEREGRELTADEAFYFNDSQRAFDELTVKIAEAEENPDPSVDNPALVPTAPRSIDVRGGRSLGRARDAALRAIDSRRDELSSDAGDRLVKLVEQDRRGIDSRYIDAVANPDYESAFAKRLIRPDTAHQEFTAEESAAVRAVADAMSQRALAEGTGSTGGYGVPFALDPTIILSSSGSINPIRQLARVITVDGTNEWRGISSDGVTASFTDEAVEATDDSPTLAQPTVVAEKAQAFVPFSIEVDQDYNSLRNELARLFADAKDELEATKFLTGSGTNEPSGLLTGLTTTQRVQTNAVATYAVGDPWLLKAAIPPRFIGASTFAAAPATWDTTYRFVGGNSTEPIQMATRQGDFLGRPKAEWSTMATGAATGTKLIVGGDFNTGYLIADRIGLTVELIPHLFGSNRRPSGQRGLYAFWRTGGKVVVPNAFRYLEVK